MRTINETFTDEEFEFLSKKKGDMSWHDYILFLVEFWRRHREEVRGK